MDAEADRAPGWRPARPRAARRRGESGRRRSFSRGAGQPAVERAGRAAEPPCGLVEGEALEVAEHDRQPEGPRQAVDLVVEGLGLLAVDRRPVGRRGRRLEPRTQPASSSASSSSPPPPAGEPIRWPCSPFGSRLRRASCPAGRGRGSTRAFRARTRKTAWKASSACWWSPRSCRQTPRTIGPCRPPAPRRRPHRPVRRRRYEPLEELAVGEPGHRAALEERPELPDQRRRCHLCHTESLSSTSGDRDQHPRLTSIPPHARYCSAAGRLVPSSRKNRQFVGETKGYVEVFPLILDRWPWSW